MKQYRKNRIRLLPTESSTTSKLSQSFLKSNKKNILNKLKTHWEIFLSTYQYSKQNLFFAPLRAFGSPEGPEATAYGPSVPTGRKRTFFYLKQEKFSSSNYFILAKIVDLLGAKHSVQNRFRQFIKLNTKYLELEKIFQIKVFKNNSSPPPNGPEREGGFLYWISYLLIEQIYQFIKRNSFFLYQAKSFAPFGPVWGKKKKIEIQKNARLPGNFLFVKCKDFQMLKWYHNKMKRWCEAQRLNKKTSSNKFNQSACVVAPTSHIRTSLLGKGCVFGFTKTISYSQDETNNLPQNFMKEECSPTGFTIHAFDGGPEGRAVSALASRNNFTKVSNADTDGPFGSTFGRLRQRYLILIKKIIKKNKVTNQVELIQKLNEIIGALADTFIINNINKRSVALKFNRILYQFLWRWGLVRHRNQKAKWIKNRYWSFQ